MNDTSSSGRGNRNTATTGNFRFAQAHMRGVVVRDGPERKVSPKGAEWMEMTILVGLYDSRQKCERERPAFVRVKALGDRSHLLDGIERRDHVSVAGALMLDVWTDRGGNTRESWELLADAVSREKFPDMAELIGRHDEPGEPGATENLDDAADPGADVPWDTGGGSEGGGGQPANPNDLTKDDIPF